VRDDLVQPEVIDAKLSDFDALLQAQKDESATPIGV
jgi:hypothetical protein